MSSNMQRLGDVLSDRMKRTSRSHTQVSIELGVINRNLSLTTDSLRTPIPKGDYMINLELASGSYRTGSASVSGSSHSHQLPAAFRSVQSGDRVLVAWCGNEPIVIAIVVGS